MPRKTVHNYIVTEELLSQVNPENIRLKNDFLDYLKSVKRSEGTIAGYDNDLKIFFVYCLEHLGNKPFNKISKRDIISFQNWLVTENQNSPSRVRRLKAAISSLSNYIEAILADDEPDYIGFRSIVKKVENPANRPVREKTVLTDEQITTLLDKLTADGKYKEACAVALALFSGRRKSELCRFRVSDFDEDKLVCGGALYKSSLIKTKGHSGGKYIHCYTLAKDFQPYLDRWMQYRKERGIESEWLLCSSVDQNSQITIGTMDRWAEQFSRILDIDFYWHSCRHRFTTYLVRAGIPDSVIQQLVSWESGDMVRVYTDIDAEEQIGMYFSDGGINVPDKKPLF